MVVLIPIAAAKWDPQKILEKGKERRTVLIGFLKNQETERMKHLSSTPLSPTLQWLTLLETNSPPHQPYFQLS